MISIEDEETKIQPMAQSIADMLPQTHRMAIEEEFKPVAEDEIKLDTEIFKAEMSGSTLSQASQVFADPF